MAVRWSARLFVVLAWIAFTSLPNFGSSAQCREPRLEKGSSGPTGDSTPDKCWCGILWTTDHRVCDSKLRVVPDRLLCDGPESEIQDCRDGHPRWIREDEQRCALVLLQIGVALTDVSVTLPICVGTICEVTGFEIVGPVPNAMEVPCEGLLEGDDAPQ